MKTQKTVKQMSFERGAYMRTMEKVQKPAPEIKQLATSIKKETNQKNSEFLLQVVQNPVMIRFMKKNLLSWAKILQK